MAISPHPRPWYRSPALWFFLPGIMFLLWAWVFSMQRVANLDFEIGGYSVQLQNEGSTAGASWRATPGRTGRRLLEFGVLPRPSWAKTNWFPLPSYFVNRISNKSAPWHYLDIPHWFLLMIYVGLWQLPWLARYHRQRRIERSLAGMRPADGSSRD